MKSITRILITSLLLVTSLAHAEEAPVNETVATLPKPATQKTFRIEASKILTIGGSEGQAVYLSYGSEFSIKTGLRQQAIKKTYYSSSLYDFGMKTLEVEYLEIPLYVSLESPDSLYYSHMGLFYAVPQKATYNNQNAKSIVQSNYGFQVEFGLRWQLKALALKLGLSSTSGFNSVTSDHSIANSNRSESAVTAGLSYTL